MNDTHPISGTDLHQEPIERAQTIPSDWYINPQVLEFEKEAVFSKYWQFACHESELPEQGEIRSPLMWLIIRYLLSGIREMSSVLFIMFANTGVVR